MANTIQVLPAEGRRVRVPNGPIIEHGVTAEAQTVQLDTFILRRLRDGDLVEVPAQTPAAATAQAVAATEARAEAAAEKAIASAPAPAPAPATATATAAARAAAAAAAQSKG